MKSFVGIIGVCILICNAQAKITLTSTKMCDDADYPLKYTSKLKTEGDEQFIEESLLSTKVDLTNDITCSIDVYLKQKGEWQFVLNHKSGVCEAKDKIAGKFADDLLMATGIEGCPIPKGEYKLQNYRLDFSTFAYQGLPEGEIKLRVEFSNTGSKDKVGCLEFELAKTK